MATNNYIHLIANRVANNFSNVSLKEGDMAAPIGQILAHMQKFLTAKYAIEVCYRNFADRIHGPWRDSLVDHWHEHAKEERANAYDLSMRIAGLGGDPIQTTIQIPPCPANTEAFFCLLMEQELEAIEAGRILAMMAGKNTSLKVLAENTVLLDTQHLDDLRRMHP